MWRTSLTQRELGKRCCAQGMMQRLLLSRCPKKAKGVSRTRSGLGGSKPAIGSATHWLETCQTEAGGPMSENKGKPSKQHVDERKERETNSDPGARRTTHRANEKGGKGASPKTAQTAKRAAAAVQAGGRR
jgi:hypothetical protein